MYQHTVHYYETDRMGITHHSNYIRWMEEARVAFLKRAGWGYEQLEAQGIMSPVTDVQCTYKKPTTFPDVISIDVQVVECKGVTLHLAYTMSNEQGEVVCQAESKHCFLDKDQRFVNLKKRFPEFYEALITFHTENER